MKNRWNKAASIGAAGALALAVVPLAMGSASGAAQKPTYAIGVEGPFSGSNAELGDWIYAGVEFAVEQANASGKNHYTLKTEKFDDQGSSTALACCRAKGCRHQGSRCGRGPGVLGCLRSCGSVLQGSARG